MFIYLFIYFSVGKIPLSHSGSSLYRCILLDPIEAVIYMSNECSVVSQSRRGNCWSNSNPSIWILCFWLPHHLENHHFMHANFIQMPVHQLLSPLAHSLSKAKLCNTRMTNLLWIKPRVIICACSLKVDFWGYSLNTLCQTWLFGYSCN